MMQAAGSTSRGRSANDCPRQNAARFVRAWQRETARAERAESLAARRSTLELQQVRVWGDVRSEQYISYSLALDVAIEMKYMWCPDVTVPDRDGGSLDILVTMSFLACLRVAQRCK